VVYGEREVKVRDMWLSVAYPGIFSGVYTRISFGVQQIQFRTEGRENGDLGAVTPSQVFHSI
jgi:hypothetical protein